MNTIITTATELELQDWEVPGMPEEVNDENIDEVVRYFEIYNEIELDGLALRLFKDAAPDFYNPNR